MIQRRRARPASKLPTSRQSLNKCDDDVSRRRLPLTRRLLLKRAVVVGFGLATALAVALAALHASLYTAPPANDAVNGYNEQHSDRDDILRILASSSNVTDFIQRQSFDGADYFSPAVASPGPYLEYHATRGLGHRLTRVAAAYHLASRLGVGLKQDWGTCPAPLPTFGEGIVDRPTSKRVGIFEHLFGEGDVTIMKGSNAMLPAADGSHRGNKTVYPKPSKLTIRNEVLGYKPYATKKLRESVLSEDSFAASLALYHQLRCRFLKRHLPRVREFIRDAKFEERDIVIGLHVRAGNNEGGEFALKERGLGDLSSWAREVARVIVAGYIAAEKPALTNPPLVFVATDTASVIEALADAFRDMEHVIGESIDVVSLPQSRSVGSGPSFKLKDERCLPAWEDQVLDMILLSLSHVVVSARYSSFTQSMPMSLVFGEDPKRQEGGTEVQVGTRYPYCELARDGTVMACFSSLEGFKARSRSRNPHRIAYTASGTSRDLYIPQKDPHEDSLVYPLAEEECLDRKRPAEGYFSNVDCLKAALLCQKIPSASSCDKKMH